MPHVHLAQPGIDKLDHRARLVLARPRRRGALGRGEQTPVEVQRYPHRAPVVVGLAAAVLQALFNPLASVLGRTVELERAAVLFVAGLDHCAPSVSLRAAVKLAVLIVGDVELPLEFLAV